MENEPFSDDKIEIKLEPSNIDDISVPNCIDKDVSDLSWIKSEKIPNIKEEPTCENDDQTENILLNSFDPLEVNVPIKQEYDVSFSTIYINENLKAEDITQTESNCDESQSETFNTVSTKNSSTNLKPYTCEICYKSYRYPSQYNKHILSHKIPSLPKAQRPQTEFKCDLCNETFSQKTDLNQHKKIHTDTKLYECDICHMQYRHKNYLTLHRRVHTGLKPYSCETCQRNFSRKDFLNSHNCANNKSHICDVCNKEFQGAYQLVRHRRIHTGSHPYACDSCDKRFTQIAHLTCHKMIHTGVRPYACDLCDRKFTKSSNLNVHRRIHTGERPYVCTICEKAFFRKSYLDSHMRLHTGDKPFVCNVCDKGFIQKVHLVAHQRYHVNGAS